jgi:hypothetical protein
MFTVVALVCGSPVSAAEITWDGGGGDLDWNNQLNWDTDVLPGQGDDVVIPDVSPDITITHSSGTTSINSLISQEAISFAGGNLQIAAASLINSSFAFAGTGLTGAGDLTVSGLLTWTGGQMSGTGSTIANGGIPRAAPAPILKLQNLLDKIDSETPPPDWMDDCEEKYDLADDTSFLISALEELQGA